MKVKGFDGKLYTLKCQQELLPDDQCSSWHLKARQLIHEIFPLDTVLEEIKIPDADLWFDFVILLRKVVFEVQGSQHYEYNKHFHNTIGKFYKSKQRDSLKKKWCEINGFKLIELDTRSYDGWTERIRNFYRYE